MEIKKFVIILLLYIYKVLCKCTIQPNTTFHGSEIFLTDQSADFDFARVMLYKTVDCCATNYTKILWYFQKTGNSIWQPYPWKPIDFTELRNRNQTLEIKRIGFNDEGVYKCVAFSAKNTIAAQHKTTIEVYSCTDRIEPEAYGPTDKYSDVGKEITFTCTGDFGCNSDSARDVSWYDENWDMLNNKTGFPRYQIKTVERANHTIVESNFTITAITEEDFFKKFRCVVSSSYEPGDKVFNVRLKKTNITKTLPPDQIAAVGTTLLVILIFTIVTVVLFYPRIKLFFLSRLPYCHLVDIGNNDYHALILHDEVEEDIHLAREIRDKLTADSYQIRLVEEIPGNQNRLEMIRNYSDESKSLIIIYPLDSYTEEFPRTIGAQEYFQPNLITVVKKKTTNQREVECLNDVALVKLNYPERLNCTLYRQQDFYCKLKLRMPRRTMKTGVRVPEDANLLNNEQINNSPFDQQAFVYDENNYPV